MTDKTTAQPPLLSEGDRVCGEYVIDRIVRYDTKVAVYLARTERDFSPRFVVWVVLAASDEDMERVRLFDSTLESGLELQHLTIPHVIAAAIERVGPVIVAERNARVVVSTRTPVSGSRRWEDAVVEVPSTPEAASSSDTSFEFVPRLTTDDVEGRPSVETLVMTRATTPASGKPPPLPSAQSTIPGIAAVTAEDAPVLLGMRALVPTMTPKAHNSDSEAPTATRSEPPVVTVSSPATVSIAPSSIPALVSALRSQSDLAPPPSTTITRYVSLAAVAVFAIYVGSQVYLTHLNHEHEIEMARVRQQELSQHTATTPPLQAVPTVAPPPIERPVAVVPVVTVPDVMPVVDVITAVVSPDVSDVSVTTPDVHVMAEASTDVPGTLVVSTVSSHPDAAEVQRVWGRLVAPVRRCVARNDVGSVRLRVTYAGRTGRPSRVEIFGAANEEPMGACIEGAVYAAPVARFASSSWQTTYVFPGR
jgi:hypothetical protein